MRERKTFVWTALAALGLCVLAAPAGAEEIDAKDLPEAVVKAIQTAYPGATINEAEVETEDGKTVYEVEIVKDKKEIDLDIAADGTILEAEEEDADDDDAEVEEDDDEDADDDDGDVEDEDDDDDGDVEDDDGADDDDDDDGDVDDDDDGEEDDD